jgi:formylglycine-generating enzyme required for sulfatase activity
MKKILLFGSLFALFLFASCKNRKITLMEVEDLANPKENYIEPEIDYAMVFVKGGDYELGSSRPLFDAEYGGFDSLFSVTLSNFYIGKLEVTRGQWIAVTGSPPPKTVKSAFFHEKYYLEGLNLPVTEVSWNEVQELFIKKLNARTGKNYRLPTEAEWEYAAAGGVKRMFGGFIYSGSDEYYEVAWNIGNASGSLREVGTLKPNELGIHDMSGNVSEFCSDWFAPYGKTPAKNPKGPASGSKRVMRGDNAWSSPYNFRRRSAISPNNEGIPVTHLGFRLACDADDKQ